ncbi:MAG: HDIG domain-containing protein [Elusimicrobia bacterium]|nr:HDIG domain-containing protein [Elusimicrobiota bacterium]
MRLTAEAVAALRRLSALRPEPVWLVGGAIRDAALDRPVADLDVASRGAKALAQAAARAFGGSFVILDAENKVYRVALRPRPRSALRQIDVAEIQGKDIAEDLARRDFTVNAVALWLPIASTAIPPAAFLDPRRGLADLKRRVLRCESGRLFTDDPLRLLRAFRVAAQCGLTIEPKTLALIRKHCGLARKPAAERVQAELMALLAVPGAPAWLKLMDDAGLLTALLPELEPARACAEEYYGVGGVLKHSLTVCARLDFLLENLRAVYPDLARSMAAAPRAPLMLAALLHDMSKPETARRDGDRLRFFGHDERGAQRAEKILRELRFSREHVRLVAAIIRHHLRPGHLAGGETITEKAAYRFFRDLGADAPGLLAVAWADHASYLPAPRLKRLLPQACARKPGPLARIRPAEARKTVRHLRLVSWLLRRFFKHDQAPVPVRLLDGRDVMKALKISPGPRVGEILELLREAQAEGRVQDRAQALAFVSRLGLDP